jgi:hypothetical protein
MLTRSHAGACPANSGGSVMIEGVTFALLALALALPGLALVLVDD